MGQVMRSPSTTDSYTRRRFLKLLAAAAGGVTIGGGTFRAARLLQQPLADVMVLGAASYSDDLHDLLLRGIREFPMLCARCQGAKVLLKPNLVEYHADRPVNTHPAVVVAAAEAFRALGAREVIVAEGPGHQRDVGLLLEYSGLGQALREADIPFVDLNLDGIGPVSLHSDHTGLGRLFLPQTLLDADLVVSMPKMKTHKWTGVTLSLKNMFGVVPGVKYGWPKNILHWRGIDQSIWDINEAVRPAFAIVDGIVGMEGNGPIDGTAVDAGVLVLGENLCAVDATTARLMGVYPERITHLAGMMEQGGAVSSERIRQLGEAVSDRRRSFVVAPHLGMIVKRPTLLQWVSAS